jgi:predicted nucleotide-binding protein (sugar kinase/HSP70/actin superfamily)
MHKKRITKKEWRETPKDYKSVIDNVKYVLALDKKTGATILEPVEVE